jgi:hypothetical protein
MQTHPPQTTKLTVKMATQDLPVPTTGEEDEDDDDYMNMTIAEPTFPKQKETYTQRRLRKEREAEARGRIKPKAEREAEERVALQSSLSASLFTNPEDASKSKGLAMMAKMGFKPGAALGKQGGRTEPVGIEIKEDRGGIGLDAEKKRKFREEVERQGKRVKAEEGDYRERLRMEKEEVRLDGMVWAAMRVAEGMESEREEQRLFEAKEDDEETTAAGKKRKISTKPLKQINVLWRGLIRKREEKQRDQRMRNDLQQSLSLRLPSYDDTNEDADDRRAMGKEATQYMLVEDLEEDDPELDEFNALDPAQRLEKLTQYLRDEYNYCFWCKFTYPDKGMDGCPGLTEDDHD